MTHGRAATCSLPEPRADMLAHPRAPQARAASRTLAQRGQDGARQAGRRQLAIRARAWEGAGPCAWRLSLRRGQTKNFLLRAKTRTITFQKCSLDHPGAPWYQHGHDFPLHATVRARTPRHRAPPRGVVRRGQTRPQGRQSCLCGRHDADRTAAPAGTGSARQHGDRKRARRRRERDGIRALLGGAGGRRQGRAGNPEAPPRLGRQAAGPGRRQRTDQHHGGARAGAGARHRGHRNRNRRNNHRGSACRRPSTREPRNRP